MGVPAFYRWLSEKYPKIVVEVLENRNAVVDGIEVPVDLTQPNPNGIEYDNLYIDMNGLIHPCSHPEDREAPSSEAEMYINVTKYVDRLFAAVRPRKVLFMAIDGVAPRAKMNQQRSRRFRAAQDTKDRQKLMDEVLQEIEEFGTMDTSSATASGGDGWDSNVITPGTEFMYNLSIYLRFYILDRMNNNPAWKNIKVILSDANEPGEGEHKIMKFIRSERSQPGYNPNQHHILHGLDADLIMLALATHEPHFTILRELVTFGGHQQRDKPTNTVSQSQQLLDAQNNHLFQRPLTTSTSSSKSAVCANPEDEWVFSKPLQSLHINILREYLEAEFSCFSTPSLIDNNINNSYNNSFNGSQYAQQQQTQSLLPFPYDFERVIDDFVFLCFFVGNDFLPHLPSLDIRDGALDFLIESYKEILPTLGDYITTPGGNVNLPQADVILGRVGEIEDLVFQRKKIAEDGLEKRRAQYSNSNKSNSGDYNNNGASSASKLQSQVTMQASVSSVPVPVPVPVSKFAPLHTRFVSPEQYPPLQHTPPLLLSTPSTTHHTQRISPHQPHQPPNIVQAPVRKLVPLNNKVAAKTLREKVLGKRSNNGTTNGLKSETTASSSAEVVSENAANVSATSVTLDSDNTNAVESDIQKLHMSDNGSNNDSTIVDNSTDNHDTSSGDSYNNDDTGPPFKKAHLMDKDITVNNNNVNVDITTINNSSSTTVGGSVSIDVTPKNLVVVTNDNVDTNIEVNVEIQINDQDDETAAIIDKNDDEADEEVSITKVLPDSIMTTLLPPQLKTVIDPAEIKRRLKMKESAKLDKNKETTLDHVRLHESGWKARYYEDPPKKTNLEEGGGLQRMRHTYVEGLCWVLKYYYEGCPSWNWYYPFHYAPFASDLVNIDRYTIKFEMSEPFRPIEQLLAVLPAESVHALPVACRWLMTEEKSPIKDLYLSDIPIDPNGKHLPWLWILLLPFIEAKRISQAFETCKHLLTLEERRRNVFSGAYIFVHSQHFLAQNLVQKKGFHYRTEKERNPEILEAMKNEGQKSVSNGSSDGKMKFVGEILCIDNGGSDESENQPIIADSNVDISASSTDITPANQSTTVSSSSASTAATSYSSSGNGSIEASQQLVAISTERNEEDEDEPLWFQRYKSAHPEVSSTAVYFNTYDGEGVCGGTTAPAYTWFTALNSTIQPPSNHPLELRLHPFFHSIVFNQVYVLTFLFPQEKAYDSRLLPGYIAKPKVLEPFDLIPRRPPKLNKSKFNMLELSQKNRQQQYGGGYQSQQYGHQNSQPYQQQQQYNKPYNQQQSQGYNQQQQQQSASYQQYNSNQQNSGTGQHHQQPSNCDTRNQVGGRGSGTSDSRDYNNRGDGGRGGGTSDSRDYNNRGDGGRGSGTSDSRDYNNRGDGGRGSGTSDSRDYNNRGDGGRGGHNNSGNTVSVAAGYQQQYQQPQQQQQYSRNQPHIQQHYASNSMINFIHAPPFYPSTNINQQQPQLQQFAPSVGSSSIVPSIPSIRGSYGHGGGYSSVGDVYSSPAVRPVASQPLMQDPYAYTQVQQQPMQYQQPRQQQQGYSNQPFQQHQQQQVPQQQYTRQEQQPQGQQYTGRGGSNSTNTNADTGGGGRSSFSFLQSSSSSTHNQQHQNQQSSNNINTVRSLEDMRKNLTQQHSSNSNQRK